MGKVRRNKKFKSVDPFYKKNLSNDKGGSRQSTTSSSFDRKSNKRKGINKEKLFDMEPEQKDFDQIKRITPLNMCDKQNIKKSGIKGKKKRKNHYPVMKEGESKKAFFNRLDVDVSKALQNARMETKTLRSKRKEHLKERDKKRKEIKKSLVQERENILHKQDKPKFGEVAYEPPVLSLPRKGEKKNTPAGLRLDHLLSSSKAVSSISTKRRRDMSELEKKAFDDERDAAIKKYRSLKVKVSSIKS